MKFITILSFLLISGFNISSINHNINNSHSNEAFAPSNDSPCGAITLDMGTHSGTTINATTTTNPEATPQCNSTPSRDVWFKSHIQSNGRLSISTTLAGGTNTPGARIALYSTGSCNHLLATDICSNGSEILIVGGINLEVYIRVWTPFTSSGTNFQIILRSNATTSTVARVWPLPIDFTPPNDNPCGAESLLANLSCNLSSGNTLDASTTSNPPSNFLCNATAFKDLWYETKVPSTGVLTLRGRTSGFTNGVKMAVYMGTCSSPINVNVCNTDELALIGEPGTTLFIRVWLFNRITGKNASGQFTICALNSNVTGQFATVLPGGRIPPVNDDACNATNLTASSNCTLTRGTTIDATLSGIPTLVPSCNSKPKQDVWYKVIIPSSEIMTISIASTSLNMKRVTMEMYMGDCSNLLTTGLCTSNPDFVVRGLAGRTIHIRIWGDNINTVGNFTICIRNFNATGIVPISIPF